MDIEELEDFVDFVLLRAPKRYIRDATNPFEFLNEYEFKRRYRFTKNIVRNVLLPLVLNDLDKANQRGLPINPLFQLLVALRFYATGNFQVISLFLYLLHFYRYSR